MISSSLIRLIEVSLDALIKTVGIDIRLHGLQNIPNQPVVYVINHFTRLETILMPYLIKNMFINFPFRLPISPFFRDK